MYPQVEDPLSQPPLRSVPEPELDPESGTATQPAGRRVPLLWLLFPLLAGAAMAALAPAPAWAPVILAAAAGLAGLAAAFLAHARLASGLLIAGGAALAFAVHAGMALQWPPVEPFPGREAILDIEVIRTFGGPAPARPSGLGRILATPPHLRHLTGAQVHWRLARGHRSPPPLAGSIWRMQGLLEHLPPPPEYGRSFGNWLAERQVRLVLGRAMATRQVRAAPPRVLRQHAVQLHLEAILRSGEPPDQPWGGMVAATLLGRRDLLPPDLRERFVLTGTFHLFAVSGLHVGTLAGLVAAMGTVLRLPRTLVAALTVIAAGSYAWATGGTPSGTRAFLLVAYLAGATALGRQPATLPALAAAAAGVLLLAPDQFTSTGFRLSYTVVAGLLLLGHPWARAIRNQPRAVPAARTDSRLVRRLQAIGTGLRATAAYSVAATTAGSCLAVQAFGIVAPGAVLLNLLLLPPAGLLVCGGLLSVTAHTLGMATLSLHLNGACHLIVEGMAWLVAVAEAGEGWVFFRREAHHPLVGGVGTLAFLVFLVALGPDRIERHAAARLLPILAVIVILAFGTRPA